MNITNRVLLAFLSLTLFSMKGFSFRENHVLQTVSNPDTVKQDIACCDTTITKSAYDDLIKNQISDATGLFTTRHIKNDWYFELPDTLLGKLMLAVTRFKAVPQEFKMLGGEEVNRSVIYWEKYGDKTLFLREYVRSQFADENNRISEAVNESVVDPIISAFDIAGVNPKNGAYLVNVSKLFLADNKLSGFTANDKKIIDVSNLAADRSYVDTIRTYPINTEITTLRTYNVTNGKTPTSRTGSATLKLNTSIVLLPTDVMKARFADERVGYFQNSVTQFADDQQKTKHRAIVHRYRLEPKDPIAYANGKLTEPVRPIVYYIDPATPKKWVPYLIAGVEDWNKAFEKAGFKNAIQAKEWPNDKEMNLDDARFCVIRYLASESENAYGPRIVDPRSGEIIESHICWYHNVMNLLKKWYMVQCGPLDKRARTMDFDDELMGSLIRFVSSHEVGHSLGLRHNMCASSATPVEKLRDRKWLEKNGHTVSIMDYARFNYVAQPEDNLTPECLFPRIGDYDKWAISWGYTYRLEFKNPYDEETALRKEVTDRLKSDNRLWYVGDEGKGLDPRSQSEDLGDNNMKANAYGIKNLKRVMDNIIEWTAQPDNQYEDLSTIYNYVRTQYTRYTLHVQKNIGGRYKNNLPGLKPNDYISKELQKEAIAWIGEYLFKAPMWLYPSDVVDRLGVKYLDEIRERNIGTLALLLSPGMIHNIYSSSLCSSSPYPLDEYLTDVFDAVWNIQNGGSDIENYIYHNLQNIYLEYLEKIFNPTEKEKANSTTLIANRSDVMLYLENHLGDIDTYISDKLAANKDDKHLQNLRRRLNKIKAAYYKEE